MRGTGHEAADWGRCIDCATLARTRPVPKLAARRASLLCREDRSRGVVSALPWTLFLVKWSEQLVGHVAFFTSRDDDHRPPESVTFCLGWPSHRQFRTHWNCADDLGVERRSGAQVGIRLGV